MQSFPKLILLSSLIVILPLGLAFAQPKPAEINATKAAPEIKQECAKSFNNEQMNDPNVPCYAQIKDTLNVRDTEGYPYDRNMQSSSREETGGGHVMPVSQIAEDTTRNIYDIPFLKSALPEFGSSSQESQGGEGTSGTD